MGKDDSKGNDALVTVNIDDFTRTRDNVICSLAQLQSAVADLSRAYINHANTVLNRGHSDIDASTLANITSALHENGLIPGIPARATSPGAKSEVGEKKKRKRAPPDPNAPKRALTPFFLYMQHNRAKIAAEMGSSAKPKDVSDEGTRRWSEMPDDEKEHWKSMYADNLAVYKEKMAAYKAGRAFSDDARAASQLQQDVETAEVTNAESSSESEEEEEETPEPEPTREPTPPRNTKRRRSEVKTPKAAETPKIPAPEVKTPAENKKASPEKKSPEKKRRTARVAKEEAPAPASARKAAEPAKRTKKKRKSEADAA